MNDQLVYLIATGLGGALAGGIIAAILVAQQYRRGMQEVGHEIVRMRGIATAKLANDDPDLSSLLHNLDVAAEQAHLAINALENQSSLTKQKSAAAREIISSSKHIVAMMEELGTNMPLVPAERAKALLPAEKQNQRQQPNLR